MFGFSAVMIYFSIEKKKCCLNECTHSTSLQSNLPFRLPILFPIITIVDKSFYKEYAKLKKKYEKELLNTVVWRFD